jgi:hypothetical protein
LERFILPEIWTRVSNLLKEKPELKRSDGNFLKNRIVGIFE